MMNNKLKPCPFCGSSNLNVFEQISGWHVYCHNRECLASVYFSQMADTKEQLIEKWNNREYNEVKECQN